MTVAMTDHTERAKFLVHLRQSGILTDADFVKVASRISASVQSGRETAQYFLDAGLLTRYQADRLLAGKAEGFRLGPYTILEPLGPNGFGKAYKARHSAMHRNVVIQVLPNTPASDTTTRTMFEEETRRAGKLAHPHLVTVLDATILGDRPYFVMEYVEGSTLDTIVKNYGPAPIARGCEFIRQAALGLHHAHERGMAHGELKPANIIVGNAGGNAGPAMVKVLNVGLRQLALFAARTGDLHAAAEAAEYLAPEQLTEPGRADVASDLYALGCILYYLLSGRPPRPIASGVLMHQMSDAVPLEALRPDVPAPVAALVHALMIHDPLCRPISALEVANQLFPYSESGVASSSVDFALPHHAGGNGAISTDSSPFADLHFEASSGYTREEIDLSTEASSRTARRGGSYRKTRGDGLSMWVIALAVVMLAVVVGALVLVLRVVSL